MSISFITPVGRPDPWLAETGQTIAQTLKLAGVEGEWVLAADGVDTEWIRDAVDGVDVRPVILGPTETQIGQQQNRNRALAVAEGDTIATIDSDDLYIPQGAADLYTAFIESGNVWAAGKMVDVDHEGNHVWDGPLIHLAPGPVPHDAYLRHLVEHGYPPFSPCSALVKREFLVETGLCWDESVTFVRTEDQAMWCRISERAEGLWVDRSVFKYRAHAASITHTNEWTTPAANVELLLTRLDSPSPSLGSLEANLLASLPEPCTCPSPYYGARCRSCEDKAVQARCFKAAVRERFVGVDLAEPHRPAA